VTQLLLAIHILAGSGLLFALGLEWTVLSRLRRAESGSQVLELAPLLRVGRLVGLPSLILVVAAGLYMAGAEWGWPSWTLVAVMSMLALPPLGAINGIRLQSLTAPAAIDPGELPHDVRARLRQPLFWTSIAIRSALVVGIVVLMAVKPDTLASITLMVGSILVGAALSVPAWIRQDV